MANYIIFGGTFDPVHNGHMRIASAASLKLNADVIFVPARSPRWKTPLTSATHRVLMHKNHQNIQQEHKFLKLHHNSH